MIYRMLAINIDGTLLQSNGKLHKSTREAVEHVLQKDVYVTLVTARSFSSAVKVAKALKLDSAKLVTQQGSFITDKIEKPIYVKRIHERLTYEVVSLLEEFPCQIRLVREDFAIANKFKLHQNILAKFVYTSGESVYDSQQFVDSLSNTLIDKPVDASKIEVYFQNPTVAMEASKVLENTFSDLSLIKINDIRLDILPEGVSKLNGLLKLCEHLGFARKEMVVIGDRIDDIPMIQAAGLGVAMGNASNEVKQAADWITRSNDQHGVAFMVKEHFRKQQAIKFLQKIKVNKQ